MPKRKSAVTKASAAQEETASNASASTDLPVLHFADRAAWESWLELHHAEPTAVWLKLGKKGCSVPTITYDEALDGALCFGWIDGQRKSRDEEHFLQRYTPRRKNSIWSRRNVDKTAVLISTGRMRPPGQAEIEAAQADGRWERAYGSSRTSAVPADLLAALGGSEEAKACFEGLNRTQKYSFLFRIQTAKSAAARKRVVGQVVKLLGEGKTS